MSSSWAMKWLGMTRCLVPKLPLPGWRGNRIAFVDAGIMVWPVAALACAGMGSAGGGSEGCVCVGRGGE